MGHDAKLTSKGQITLPAKLRKKLGLQPGDHVEFTEGPDGSFSLTKKTRSFNDLRGIVKLDKPATAEQIDAWIAEARAAIGSRS